MIPRIPQIIQITTRSSSSPVSPSNISFSFSVTAIAFNLNYKLLNYNIQLQKVPKTSKISI